MPPAIRKCIGSQRRTGWASGGGLIHGPISSFKVQVFLLIILFFWNCLSPCLWVGGVLLVVVRTTCFLLIKGELFSCKCWRKILSFRLSESTYGLDASKITRGMLCAHWLSPKLHTSRRQGGLLWAGLIMIGLYDHVHLESGVNSPDWICVTGGRWVESMLGSQLQCQPQYQKLNSPHLLIPLNLGLPSVFSISVNSPIINLTTLTEARVTLRFLFVAPTQWFI